jgi:hypothetical protein
MKCGFQLVVVTNEVSQDLGDSSNVIAKDFGLRFRMPPIRALVDYFDNGSQIVLDRTEDLRGCRISRLDAAGIRGDPTVKKRPA